MSFQQQLRDILFKAAGGVSDMANDEIAAIVALIESEIIGSTEELPKDIEERVYVVPSRNKLREEQRERLHG